MQNLFDKTPHLVTDPVRIVEKKFGLHDQQQRLSVEQAQMGF